MWEGLKELMKDEIEDMKKEIEESYARGWKEDWKEGWIEGWKEGWKKGKNETIYSVVSEGDISPERGAQILGISVEQLKSDINTWAERDV